MAIPTRELSITYGSITVGGISTDYLLDGFTRHSVIDGKTDSFVEFDCVAKASSAAALAALCRSIERAFRTPRQSLTVSLSGSVLLLAHHDDAEGGFNTEPQIRKIGDVGDSGRSRRYTLRVSYETPADTATTSGLRESTINVDYDPSRIRTIRIAGVFTAVPGTTDARDVYEAAIAAHVASALLGLSVTTSEIVGEPVTEQDYDNKVLRFERTYRELIFGQGQDAANDDAAIVDQTLSVVRREFSEERSPTTAIIQGSGGGVSGGGSSLVAPGTVQQLAAFDLHYECSIDNTSSTDLKAKYDGLRSWLLSQFSGVFSQGTFALTVERVETDRVRNRILVDMTAEGSTKGADILSRTVTSEKRETPGLVFRGKWTGNPLDYYVYQGHDVVLRITTASARHLTTKDPATVEKQNEEFAESFGGFAGGGSGLTVEKSSTTTPQRIGIEGSGHVLNLLDVTSTVTTRLVNASGGGGSAFDPQIVTRGAFQFRTPLPVQGG
jgi:hypothetical protein